MATFRKRNDKWHVQIRRTGFPTKSKSFLSKAEAQKWARKIELDMDQGLISGNAQPLKDLTVSALLTRYRDTVSVKKRGHASERKRLEVFLRYDWAQLPLDKVTSQTFAAFRDERLQSVRPATVVRELGIIRSVFETALNEWDIPLAENPVARVRKPKQPDARNRRLKDGELELLLKGCEASRNDWLRIGILLAIETGMRRGELLNMKWQDIDWNTSTLLIPHTKNGHARRIPLTPNAVHILEQWREIGTNPEKRILDVSANAFRLTWERCKRRTAKTYPAIIDLRFHDLRHEAVSRFFEMGLSVPEVALISGHRDPRMLFRYTHLKPQDLVAKLRETSRTVQQGSAVHA